eukprot:6177521-Pleurochrysis_carterae.AAC.1
MQKLGKQKVNAHAAKRAAVARAATATAATGKEIKKVDDAPALADELQQRVEELEWSSRAARQTGALSKLRMIRQLSTEGGGEGRGRRRWWPWWVQAIVMEQLINGSCGRHQYGAPLRPWRYE